MRTKFGVLEQTQGLHLPAKFHLTVFIVSASGGQKQQFCANFDIFGGSCIDALLPMRAKFGVAIKHITDDIFFLSGRQRTGALCV